jgi:hypothetical protein
MTPREFIELWIADLRSGRYNQGRRQLSKFYKFARNNDGIYENDLKHWRHCCLGVACETAEGLGMVRMTEYSNPMSDERSYKWLAPSLRVTEPAYTNLPKPMLQWLGWTNKSIPEDAVVKMVGFHYDSRLITNQLMRLNDSEEWSFEQIATWVERFILPMYDEETGLMK